jgi:hypothetical protein
MKQSRSLALTHEQVASWCMTAGLTDELAAKCRCACRGGAGVVDVPAGAALVPVVTLAHRQFREEAMVGQLPRSNSPPPARHA